MIDGFVGRQPYHDGQRVEIERRLGAGAEVTFLGELPKAHRYSFNSGGEASAAGGGKENRRRRFRVTIGRPKFRALPRGGPKHLEAATNVP